ncbi:MAG TPA: thymidylate synthase [Patescibacteria group bacterium]|nr:thymidylate synthase [Patescibacteria group bacterium]
MKYSYIKAFDIPGAWFRTLEEIWFEGDEFWVGYGSEVTETRKLNLSIEITNPETRPIVAEKAPCDMKYITSYALQYLWAGVKEEGETYTYASRLREPVDQVEQVIERYVVEPRDRQLTMVIRQPHDIYTEIDGMRHEPPCLTVMDTELLEDKLHLTCYFRSWDAFAGLPANVAGIQVFNEALVSEINARAGTDYTTGKLIFHSKNCHIYSRLYELVEELIKPGEDARRQLGKERQDP